MNISKLSKILTAEPKFRWTQINQALFQDYISDWSEASNLPKALREKLTAECPLEIKAKIFKSAGDQRSEKALITLEDGAEIETVLIRQKGKKNKSGDQDLSKVGDSSKVRNTSKVRNSSGNPVLSGGQNFSGVEGLSGRNTICVSSQAGCPLGCTFCATGAAGFQRNLKAEEIVEQVIFWARYLKKESLTEKIDNIVFMGMGEPFLNYAEFIKAAKFLNNPETLNIGARRLSVSTAGLTEGIKRLAGEKLQMNLAISLHAPDDALRQELMPIAKKYPLKEIFKAVDDYIYKTGRRVMFEYLMIKGVNDRDSDALALVELLRRPLYLLNLIPYNSIGSAGKFKPAERSRIEEFKKILETKGVSVTVRMSFGGEISAACGQLSGKRR